MIRLLHIADVHLGAALSAFGEAAAARSEQIHRAFRALPDIARDESVDAVVIAGDLFDAPRPSASLAAMARETVRRIGEDGTHVFIVPGNHDPITVRPNPWTEPFGGAHVFTAAEFGEPVSVETSGGLLHVYGVAHDPSREAEPLSTFERRDLPGVHVVVMHGSVEFCPHWQASPNALRLTVEVLGHLGADYVALGDYHRFRAPNDFRGGAAMPACYCGSFAAIDLTEMGQRGYVIADLEPGAAPVVQHHSSGVPHMEPVGEVDVSFYASEVEVACAIAERVSDGSAIPVVALRGAPSFPLDPEIVATELKARFPFAHVEDRSRFYDSQRLHELADPDTIVGHVVRLGRRRIEEARDELERHVAERALRVALQSLEVG